MTEQEIFDRVWNFLNLQGKPAYDSAIGCCYRTEDGLACAVGCLLDDDTAHSFDRFENKSIYSISKSFIYKFPEELRQHVCFLEDLQSIHDRNVNTPDWLSRWRADMIQFATDRGLTVPTIP